MSAAGKVALAGGALAFVLFRTRNIPREELGLIRPPPLISAAMLALYIAWMLASNAAIHWRGPWDFTPWLQAPVLASVLRLCAVSLLGPIVEELIFRGWFYSVLDKRVGAGIAIPVTSVTWALLHYSYGWAVVLVIVVDGILLGIARWRTKSVYTPMVMHALYNFYAIW